MFNLGYGSVDHSLRVTNRIGVFAYSYMHEKGLGVPKDYSLAKRYYDQALESDPEAFVPVRLALLRLWLRQWWESWFTTPTAKSEEKTAKALVPAPTTP